MLLPAQRVIRGDVFVPNTEQCEDENRPQDESNKKAKIRLDLQGVAQPILAQICQESRERSCKSMQSWFSRRTRKRQASGGYQRVQRLTFWHYKRWTRS